MGVHFALSRLSNSMTDTKTGKRELTTVFLPCEG